VTAPTPIIVDTNIVVAGLITRDATGPTATVLDGLLSGQVRALMSSALVDEYRRVLLRPKLRQLHGLSAEGVETILAGLAQHATFIEPEPVELPENPGDAHVVSIIHAWPEALLITGDAALARLVANWAPTLTPTEWAQMTAPPGLPPDRNR